MGKHHRRWGIAAVATAGAVVIAGAVWGLGVNTQPAAATVEAPTMPAIADCRLADLQPRVEQAGPAGDDHVVRISWTNTSPETCIMRGYGGIDLEGPPYPGGSTYSVPRAPGTPPTVTLASGAAGETDLYYQPANPASSWAPTHIEITPPNETHSAPLFWPVGAISRQPGATYLEPVIPR